LTHPPPLVDSIDPASIDRQNRVLSLLGISIDSLYSAITKKNLNFAGNIVEKNLDHHESIIARDALACQLYSALFRWIVAKTNEGIAAKFPSSNRSKVSRLFEEPFSDSTTTVAADNLPKNQFFLYDLTGFENLDSGYGIGNHGNGNGNGLQQLCINYSNERIFQFLNQIVYILDKELFLTENLLTTTTAAITMTSYDNSQTIRLLDNRSNGIFTICDDQLKLKSSTSDEKLASILYAQHGNNKNFYKTEQKKSEFVIKHYATSASSSSSSSSSTGSGVCHVTYNVLGFTNSNKLEPTTEILECLKSSNLPFIREEIYSFCDFKSLATTATPQSGLSPSPEINNATAASGVSLRQSSSRNLLDRSPSGRNLFDNNRSPSSRNLFEKSPSSRNILSARNSFDTNEPRRDPFLKQRSFAHSTSNISSSSSPTAPGRGLIRAPSLAVRGPGTPPTPRNNSTKVTTLASSCSAMMTEILAEAKLCDVTFFMCLKVNDCNDPLKFDQHTVLRQLKPYGIPDILSFYHQSYPYRMDHVSFVNRFCILSLICVKDPKKSHEFMIALWECRSRGMESTKEWQELCQELIPLIPSLPEFDQMSGPLINSSTPMTDDEQMKAILNGIKVGELNVYLTALSYTYLNVLQRFTIELLKQKIWNFYKHSKSKSRQKAGVVIGSLMLKLLERTRTSKELKKKASIIAIQARVRCFIVHRRLRKAKQQEQGHEEQVGVVVMDTVGDAPVPVDSFQQELETEIAQLEQQLSVPADPSEDRDGESEGGALMISFDFDDVSHNELTHDVILEKVVDYDSIDLNRNEGNVNLEDMSSKEPESIDPAMATLNHLYAHRNYSVSNDDTANEEEDVQQVTNVDEILDDESLEPIQVDHSHSPPSAQNLLHHFNADGEGNGNRDVTNRDHSRSFHSSLSHSSSGMLSPANQPPLSLAQQARITELQSQVDNLEAENSRLRRKLESLSSFVREEEKTPEPQTPTTSNPKKLASRMSSTQSQYGIDTSVYGGEYSRSPEHFHSSPSTDLRPDYEKYVQKTLETLDEDITYLLHGAPFYKFGRSGSVHKTLIHLSTDFRYLYWKPKNSLVKSSDDCRVDLRLVWRLVPGQSTPPFQAYKGISHGPMPPKRSFSLIYGFRSLDLCALDDECYDNWFIGLKYVLQLINGELQEAGLDRQLLRKKWNYVDRNNYGFLSRKEIIQLVSALGIQFDRSTFTTALLKSTIGNSTHDEITFSQFDSLVYQLRRRPDLEILWSKVITGYDFSKDIIPLQMDGPFDSSILQEVIGVTTFKEFWKLSQHRVLSDDEAKKMIAEGMGEMHQEDFPVLSFNGFVSIMTHYKNDAYDPISCVHSSKSMTHPLQHYYISSSDGAAVDIPNQEYYQSICLEENRSNSYVIALQSGCRALELRCFEEAINPQGEQTDLFVGNPRNKERVTFKETMLHIHRVAFSTTHFPLILLMEVACSVSQQKRAGKLLVKLFGNAIFTPAETQTKLLPSPLELKNRVLIFLIHRKRDIHTAYRVAAREIDRSNTAGSISTSQRGGHGNGHGGVGISGANDSFMSMKSNQSFDPDRKPHRPIIQQISESFDYVEEDVNDYDSESEYGLDPPVNSVSPKHRSHSKVPRSHYLALDQEAMGKNGTLDKSQMELIQKCDVIHSSLMRLCHYSRGLRVGSHPLRDMLARLSDDPQAEESLINFNLKRFTYIYMDQNTKKFGSYGGIVNAWDCGISMVSLCHDYPSLGTKINSGKFRQNGNCGFVLKPERCREPISSSGAGVDDESPPLMLTLHIISGKDLPVPKMTETTQEFYSPLPNSNGYPHSPSLIASGKKSYSRQYTEQDNKSADSRIIRSETHDLNSAGGGAGGSGRIRSKGYSVGIDLNGATCDDIQNKTRSIKRHGRSPYWNEVFTFSVKEKSQGQLTLRIFYNDSCSCYVSIPLQNLRSGYRSVALYEEIEENNFISSRLTLGTLFIRIRFDEIAQYKNLQTLPENLKMMEESKRSHPRRLGSHIMTTPASEGKHHRRNSNESKEREIRRSRSEGRGGSGTGGGARRTQSRSSTRGMMVSYDSTPIIQEDDHQGDQDGHSGHRQTSHRASGVVDFSNTTGPDLSGPSRVRSRRETRRKSETSYEVSEEMTNHYGGGDPEEIQTSFSYHDVVIEAEKEQNAKKLSLKRLSERVKHNTSPPPAQPPPPPARAAPPAPPPPPPRNQHNGQGQQGQQQEDEEHLPSYNSAVNLIELREQNARNIQKFDVDSGDEEGGTDSNRPSMDPWSPPV
jgi:hypothetical protein